MRKLETDGGLNRPGIKRKVPEPDNRFLNSLGSICWLTNRDPMAFLRKYIWVVLILVMIFVSLVIGIIFVFINKCISKKGRHRILQLQGRSDGRVESNKYLLNHPDTGTPPLPPRTQFLTAEAQSYENLAEGQEGDDQSDHDYEEALDQKLDTVKVQDNTGTFRPPPTCNLPNSNSNISAGQSYENLAEENDYEESTDQQPDYVKVEDETQSFAPPTLCEDSNMKCSSSLAQSYENLADQNEYEESMDQQSDYVKVEDEEVFPPPPTEGGRDNISTASTEDYDDIGAEDEEDYDDVA
ncbi:PREDICTED: uncharacterized protein LOC107093074 isoform X2 [Cyprinodon variegatus]|uniref:uncharacterized protein LOC107093074 isoform X2 n=1 Tax=Cyprinodon variegatus TaxID=28743 RepID=UPI000742AF04|nr:PREDICTED: uncharacterized protein LOC107093074 isoform X2 [Cyprinodon variegatus]